jgi:hypothetical protein
MAAVLTTFALTLAACSGSSKPAGAAFTNLRNPMAIHLAPDGRVVVAEAGTGANDGRVQVIAADGSRAEVVFVDLPSVKGANEPWGNVAGATGAAMAKDGVVCVAIGIPAVPGPALGELRCTDGLKADLAAWEARNDPDGLGPASRPFDVVPDEDDGWWVSDALANTVLHVGRDGNITLAGVFPTFGTFATRAEGRPTGLTIAPRGMVPAGSLGPRGGIPEQGGVAVALYNGAIAVLRPVEPADPGLGFANVAAAIAVFADEEAMLFAANAGDRAGVFDTARAALWEGRGATGFVRLGDGTLLVAVAGEGRIVAR